MSLIKTESHYLCSECKYEGPVDCIEIIDREPYGNRMVNRYSYEDHQCPSCGSYEIEEC